VDVAEALCCLLAGYIAKQEDTDVRQGARIARQLFKDLAKQQRYIVNKNGVVIDVETGQQVEPVSFN
jgi:hypothetical protein